MTFRHPVNGYQKRIDSPGAFTLIGGPIYFALHGVWLHAGLSVVLAVLTMGVSWLVYPLASEGIMRNAYLTRGWTEVAEPPREHRPIWTPDVKRAVAILVGVIAVIVVLATAVDWYLHPEFYARVLGYGQ